MASRSSGGFGRRRSRAYRGVSTRAGRGRPFVLRPLLEVMERRISLTGDITITNALVDNADIQPLTTVNVGEWVYIQAEFTTQNLPSNASYRVAFTVNGLTVYSPWGDWGAGQQTGSGNPCWGKFSASAGTNDVTVIIDPDHSLALSGVTPAPPSASVSMRNLSPAVGYRLLFGGPGSLGLRSRWYSRLRVRHSRRIQANDCHRRLRLLIPDYLPAISMASTPG